MTPSGILRKRTHLLEFISVTSLALVVRFVFLWQIETPFFDPWRHMVLFRNLADGDGFTLFAGQPYLWYNFVWYRLAALLHPVVSPLVFAGLLSAACVGFLYLFVRRIDPESSAPLIASALLAIHGPTINFTCHLGSESMALCCLLAALYLSTHERWWSLVLAGMLMAICLVSRMNFAPAIFLFLFSLSIRRYVAFVAAVVVGLLPFWIYNFSVISAHEYLFTWDGLATDTEGFNLISTLVVPMHPTVQATALKTYLEMAVYPEWIHGPRGYCVGTIVFMALGTIMTLISRRKETIATLAVFCILILLFDRSMTGYFFRHYLIVFIVCFIATAQVVARLRGKWTAVVVVVVFGGLDAGYLMPEPFYPIEDLTPPREFLTEDHYMANSGTYHPESLAFAFPDKKFIGLPGDHSEWSNFVKNYPTYKRFILWRRYHSVQDDLILMLRHHGTYKVIRTTTNSIGIEYSVLEEQ